jgi:hypothetical protein
LFEQINKLSNGFNPGVIKDSIKFYNQNLFDSFSDIELVADYVCNYFPHWMLEKVEDGEIIFKHPWNSDYFLDPNIIEHVSEQDLLSLCGNLIRGNNYDITFEDSYFLDYFIDNYNENEEYVIIHIDHHSDRGPIFANFDENKFQFELSSTNELVDAEFGSVSLAKLRENGIIHQGNFLSFLATSKAAIHVVFASDELTTQPVTCDVTPTSNLDEHGFLITKYLLIEETFEKGDYKWTEGPRDLLQEMIVSVIEKMPNAQILVHIDLDEYDNPWDGNTVNQHNVPCDTEHVLDEFSKDLKIINDFNPKYFHYCMPTGFFPSKHWISCIKFLRNHHD